MRGREGGRTEQGAIESSMDKLKQLESNWQEASSSADKRLGGGRERSRTSLASLMGPGTKSRGMTGSLMLDSKQLAEFASIDLESKKPVKDDFDLKMTTEPSASTRSNTDDLPSEGRLKSKTFSIADMRKTVGNHSAKVEDETKSFNSKLALLSNAWNSVKQGDLETIEEKVSGRQERSHPVGRQVASSKNTRKEPMQSYSTTQPPITSSLKKNAVKPGSASNTFDLAKKMEELDQIKKKVEVSSAAKKPVGHRGRKIPSTDIKEEETKIKSNPVKQATIRKVEAAQASQARKGIALRARKQIDEVEQAFAAAVRKVEEFNRDTGQHVSTHDLNKEWQRVIDMMKDVHKKLN